jgi:hypothetical protein
MGVSMRVAMPGITLIILFCGQYLRDPPLSHTIRVRILAGRRTQVAKGEVCKTSMQRFKSARRLHHSQHIIEFINSRDRLLARISHQVS